MRIFCTKIASASIKISHGTTELKTGKSLLL